MTVIDSALNEVHQPPLWFRLLPVPLISLYRIIQSVSVSQRIDFNTNHINRRVCALVFNEWMKQTKKWYLNAPRVRVATLAWRHHNMCNPGTLGLLLNILFLLFYLLILLDVLCQRILSHSDCFLSLCTIPSCTTLYCLRELIYVNEEKWIL